MPINYKKTVAVLDGLCEIEEAEELLAWLSSPSQSKVNLKSCTKPHTAVLQVLMAANPTVSAWPSEPIWRKSLKSLLNNQ